MAEEKVMDQELVDETAEEAVEKMKKKKLLLKSSLKL